MGNKNSINMNKGPKRCDKFEESNNNVICLGGNKEHYRMQSDLKSNDTN